MGVSTNGIIAFGVTCKEGTEFPWDDEKFEGDIEEWWREENGFKDIHQPWTPEGEYAEGWTRDDPRFEEHYSRRIEWLKQNPLPIVPENYCSGEYPMWAIVVPEVGLSCRRGYPVSFNPLALQVSQEQINKLRVFLYKYKIEYENEPNWLLLSYWG